MERYWYIFPVVSKKTFRLTDCLPEHQQTHLLLPVPEGVGGRTVFPEDHFSKVPIEGSALLYRSKTELLHFSEAMTSTNEKWIMQLLLDYNHDYAHGDTITDFRTGASYIWDGN